MRLLDPPLSSAMDSGNYDPYFLVTIKDKYNGNLILSASPVGYELGDLELTVTVQMAAYLDVPFYRTSLVLTRGVTIAGSVYTLSTSNFTIIKSTWDGNFQTFKCHLIPRVHYSAPGDVTYQTLITNFCAAFGKTAVFLQPGAAWLSYQFLPTGKTMTLNNAQTLFQQLKQKYFIFACDNGSDQILFYTAFTHVTSPQYQITGYRFAVDYNVDQRRQYIWRDENETLHKTTPSFPSYVQLSAAVQAVMSLLDLGSGVVLAGSYKNVDGGGKIFRSTDYGATWDAGLSLGFTNYAGIYSLLNLGNGRLLAAGYYQIPIFLSIDYGLSWSPVYTTGADTTGCLCDCGNGIVLCGTASPAAKIYRSTDSGATWSLAATLGAETAIYSILYVGSGVCLAGTSTGGKIYRSTDYGQTWNLVQRLGAETAVYSLLGLGSGIVFAGTNPTGTIYKSTDGGQTWSLVFTSGEQTIYTLNTLGGGVLLAGSGPAGKMFRSVDYGATWSLVQALGTENSIRSFLTMGNGSTLAGTGEHAYIFKSLNCAADLDVIHNLGFLPSTASEPSAYFLLAAPKFEPFPVHLKYQSSDFIRVLMSAVPSSIPGVQTTYDFTCAEVTEVLDLHSKYFPYHMRITQTPWLTDTAAGPLPSTIERVASYTPLVTTNFNNVLSVNDNNLQAAMDTLDDHTRKKLLTGLTYYVATTGNDSNDGKSVSTPFLTLQHAVDVVAGLDVSGKTVTIQLADGTYTGQITLKNVEGTIGAGQLVIQGNNATPANVVISTNGPAFVGSYLTSIWDIKDLTITTVGATADCLQMSFGTVVRFSNLVFGSCGRNHIYLQVNAKALCIGNYAISGGGNAHIISTYQSYFLVNSRTITITNTPAFSVFAEADYTGMIRMYSNTYSGAATGVRFSVSMNGLIYTNGAGLTALPGNAAGTFLGGLYDDQSMMSPSGGGVGFFGVGPAARPGAYTQTYSTPSHTVPNNTAANPPAGGTGATAGAYDTAAHRDAMITSLTNAIADITALKQVVNGIIDDLQSLGIFQ
ncbi:MAG TPA: hypothetical protein VMT91_13970 [Anaerolineales bacterium]|nr:hypothetical protein [Anaerolineales bacterium]